MHGPRLVALLLTGALSLLPLGGCTQVQDQSDDRRVDADAVGSSVSVPILDTVEVGLLDGMVSILVRNGTGRLLRHADAVIDVVDDQGRSLAGSSTSDDAGYCCTAVNLAPDESFGFWVQIVDPADPAAPAADLTLADLDVHVTYENVVWASGSSEGGPVAAARPDPLLPISPIDPANPALGVSVTFLVDTAGGILDQAVAQAVLTGPDGALAAVVTGTLPCLDPAGNPTSQRLQLYHQPPEGTTVSSVSVFSLDGVPDPGAPTPPADAACPLA